MDGRTFSAEERRAARARIKKWSEKGEMPPLPIDPQEQAKSIVSVFLRDPDQSRQEMLAAWLAEGLMLAQHRRISDWGWIAKSTGFGKVS